MNYTSRHTEIKETSRFTVGFWYLKLFLYVMAYLTHFLLVSHKWDGPLTSQQPHPGFTDFDKRTHFIKKKDYLFR